jgi:hypothetical protein
MSSIARMEELLATGCYQLKAVADRRDDHLVLGRVHRATYARLDHICDPRPGEYDRIWVELKTDDEKAWARRHVEGGALAAGEAPAGEGEDFGGAADPVAGEGEAEPVAGDASLGEADPA